MGKLRNQVIKLAYQNPGLRAHLMPLLKEASSSWVAVRGGERKMYSDAVWDMYEQTYRKLGLHIPNAQALLKYDVWNLYIEEGQPLAFSLNTSTPYGQKAGVSGTDQSATSKSAMASFMRDRSQKEGFFGEASHKSLAISLAAGAPVVCGSLVPSIIGKPVEVLPDGVSYKRALPGVGNVTKVLVGRPRGIPTTSYTNPQCPVTEPVNHYASTLEPELDWMAAQSHVACLIKA